MWQNGYPRLWRTIKGELRWQNVTGPVSANNKIKLPNHSHLSVFSFIRSISLNNIFLLIEVK